MSAEGQWRDDEHTRLLRINARSCYRWLFDLRRDHGGAGLSVEYTRGHANDAAARGSILNSLADYYASTAQGYVHDLSPSAPVPTFFMDDYTFATEADEWIEFSPRLFFMHHRARQQARELETGHDTNRMVSSLYSPAHPEFPYTRALSAYSALVQLYARSGQLPTAETLSERARGDPLSPFCRFGCRTMKSDFHLFVECPRFDSYRSEAGERPCARIGRRLGATPLREGDTTALQRASELFYTDTAIPWPMGYPHFTRTSISDTSRYYEV
ncbi:hypothetical protein AURDEDRAFT_168694 [Auricularia subglabra TFB-10046 SS5]|nr:hypothetical protein AURDEDRAFT_168694 [Auricularia subglabra TFB-10046 SS5]